MLKNAIEDYLTSTSEKEFFILFPGILESEGFTDIHFLHGMTEFGRDFIAKKDGIQFSFQLKAGDLDVSSFRNVKEQLLEAYTMPIVHPEFDKEITHNVVLVTTGRIKPVCSPIVAGFNEFLQNNLQQIPLITWDYDFILNILYNNNFDKYFESYIDNSNIIELLKILSTIANGDYNWFLFESYSNNWLKVPNTQVEQLRPFIETSLFGMLLKKREDYYYLFVLYNCLYRYCISSNKDVKYLSIIELELKDIVGHISHNIKVLYKCNTSLITNIEHDTIFNYPKYCLQNAEIIAVGLLLGYLPSKNIDILERIIKQEKGVTYIVSDNYAVSFYLITLALAKYGKSELLKKYINNSAFWLSNQIDKFGIARVGSDEIEEDEQLISEYLTGFDKTHRRSSFAATILLFIALQNTDENLFKTIVNDMLASKTILVHYHILDTTSLWVYESDTISEASETNYLEEYSLEFSEELQYNINNCNLTINKTELILSMFLLRDRFFPKYYTELINSDE